MAEYDVIIVGTRVAGAPLAMLLARCGCRVLGLDRATFPSDTMSTHFMWPRTTARLAAWGLLDRLAATGCPLVESVLFDVGSAAIRSAPDPVDGIRAMYCAKRIVLDALLVEAAREAGAEMREGVMASALLWDGDTVVGVEVTDESGSRREARAQLVVGADGLASSVARWVEAPTEVEHPSLSCAYYAYWSGVPMEGVEFYQRTGCIILAFPTHDGHTCVYVGRPYAESRAYAADIMAGYLAGVDLAPDLSRRLRAGRQAQAFRGTNRLPNLYRRAYGPGWALVGDAAYHRDPLSGMGIGDAFLGAQLLADAFVAAKRAGEPLGAALAGYAGALRQGTQAVFDYTVDAARLRDQAPLVPFFAAIARDEALTRRLMNVLGGTLPHRELFNRRVIDGVVDRGGGA